MRCPKCGGDMCEVPGGTWTLYEVRVTEYICPSCLHIEKVKTIVLRRER